MLIIYQRQKAAHQWNDLGGVGKQSFALYMFWKIQRKEFPFHLSCLRLARRNLETCSEDNSIYFKFILFKSVRHCH